MIQLGVNIDHVATLRQARYREPGHGGLKAEPDPVEAAAACLRAGASSITLHLREDRRHVQDDDVRRVHRELKAPVNLEMSLAPAILEFALELRPPEACLVPESRQEVTTEGGLDVAGQESRVREAVRRLQDAGIRTSLFIDPVPQQVEASARAGAPCIELHTGAYANAATEAALASHLRLLQDAARQAHGLGLQVNAGHGLNYTNLPRFLATPHLHTLNIGHSIVSRAIGVGMQQAACEMFALIRKGPTA
jgi:pyridoxine 5-phosphate synthase